MKFKLEDAFKGIIESNQQAAKSYLGYEEIVRLMRENTNKKNPRDLDDDEILLMFEQGMTKEHRLHFLNLTIDLPWVKKVMTHNAVELISEHIRDECTIHDHEEAEYAYEN